MASLDEPIPALPLPPPARSRGASEEIGDDHRSAEEFLPSPPAAQAADHPPSIWQRREIVNIVSFATSLALHALVVIIGVLVVREVQYASTPKEDQVIIPDAAIIEGAPVGGVPNPGLGGDPLRASAQDQVRDVSSSTESWNRQRGESLTQSLMGGSADSPAEDSVIAPGVRPGLGLGNTPGSGSGETGDGSSAAPFGVPGGGSGQGPKANFIGVSGNARTVAYVCDASGSMMNMMFALKAELRKAVDILRPSQAFNVVFFSGKDTRPQALSNQGLLIANPKNKRDAFKFLDDVVTSGATDPIPGLEIAFRSRPQLVYLLTDGNFPNNEEVLAKVRQMNADKRTKINTILFCDAANIEKGIAELLKQIADENGGVFKIVDTKDF